MGDVTAPLPSASQWHYIAGTYDGATRVLYVDGMEVNSASGSGSIPTSTDPLDIGDKLGSSTAGDHFYGNI